MRLLYIVHQFFPEFASGTERVTLNLARMAQRAGHRVEVLTCTLDPQRLAGAQAGPVPGSWRAWVEGIPVCYLDRAQLPAHAESAFEVSAPLRDTLVAWMRAQPFDVVHVMHSMRMGSAIAAVQALGLPMVASLTDFHPMCLRTNLMDAAGRCCAGPELGEACQRRCPMPGWDRAAVQGRLAQARSWLGYAAARVAPSNHVAERYREAFPDLSVQVIPHGVEGLQFLGVEAAREAEPAAPRWLFVGSLIEIKGLHVVLEALARHPEWQVHLDVAGALHGDPLYQQRVRRLMAADPRVQWHGQQSQTEVRRLMGAAHMLLLPSLVPETFSLALHEGFAAGLPAWVSDLGAPAQTVRSSGAGEVLPAGDVAAWAAALGAALAEPERMRQWARAVQPPLRIEEEAFLTESLYWAALAEG